MVSLLVASCGGSKSPEAPKPVPAPAPVPAKPAPNAADTDPENQCPKDNGVKKTRYGAFDVTVTRAEDDCSVTVNAGGALLASDETGLAVDVESADLDKDGIPELLVVADSGGSSLHANNYVFTEKPAPRMVSMFDGCGARIAAAPDGRRAVLTCELSMNMMDGVCNGCSPRPRIYYMLEDGKLLRRNELFVAEYDRIIDLEVKELKPEDVQNFLATKDTGDGVYQNSPARDALMRIAAHYIYSGRDTQAKEVIDKNWPAFDRERIFDDLKAHAP